MKPATMALIRVRENYQVSIPVSICKELHLEQGSILEAVTNHDKIVLKPKVVVDADRVEVEKAMEDLRAGRLTDPFASVEEFKKSLTYLGFSTNVLTKIVVL